MPSDRTFRDRVAAGEMELHGALGVDWHVRTIRPSDASSMIRGYDALSEEGKWFRMLHAMPHLSPAMAARFSDLDPDTDFCVVIEGRPELEGLGDEIVGGARIAAGGPGADAEFAVSMRPEVRGRGLAKGALRIALAAAKEMGCANVHGLISHENAPMKGLARSLGFRLRRDPDDMSLIRAEMTADALPDPAEACAGVC